MPCLLVVFARVGTLSHPPGPVTQTREITCLLTGTRAVLEFEAINSGEYGFPSPEGATQSGGLAIVAVTEAALTRALPLQISKAILQAQHPLQ